MFVFFYIIIVFCVLGFFIWSALVLREQKTAWAKFAAQRGLTCTSGRFMEAARVQGTIEGVGFSLFSDTQQTKDVRGERHVSVLELELGGGLPTGGAIGTPEMRGFIDTLSFTETCRPEHEKWKPEYIARTRDAAALQPYLTAERLTALLDVFGMNRVSVLYFFDEKDSILHLETVDPLRDPVKLDRIVTRILADAKKLQVPRGEDSLPVAVEPYVEETISGGEETDVPPPITPSL